MDARSIVRALTAERRARGWTQEQVAEAGGFKQSSLSYWENGRQRPSLDSLVAWASAFGKRIALEDVPS